MENKEKFIDRLGEIMMLYSLEDVEKLEYIRKDSEELVCIIYTDGYKKYNIWGDSCIAIMSDALIAKRF